MLDSVVEGVTGRLYRPSGQGDEVEVLAAAMRAFDASDFDPTGIREHAERFSPTAFRQRLAAKVEAVVAQAGSDRPDSSRSNDPRLRVV